MKFDSKKLQLFQSLQFGNPGGQQTVNQVHNGSQPNREQP